MKIDLKKNLGLKLIAFLFSFLLWLIVVNIDNPIVTKTFSGIPVTVEHTEVLAERQKTFQIVDDTQNVNVTVSAKRRVMSRIKAEDIVVTADMKELYLDSQIPLSVTINGHEGSYESAVTRPRNLQIQIEDNKSKTINITPVATGTVRDGYVLGSLKTDPETVTINGPESLVAKINKIVAQVNVSGLSQNTSLDSEVMILDKDGNVIDPSRLGNNLGDYGVHVRAYLYQVKTVPVELDTSGIIVPEGYSISSVKITPEEIDIAGPNNVLSRVKTIMIPSSELEGKEVNAKTEFTIDIRDYLPEGIQLVDSMANNVIASVTVKKEGVQNYELPVGSIAIRNLADKLKLTYTTSEDLEVHIRGSRAAIGSFNVEKAASINLEMYKEAGTYKIPVKIELPEGCSLEEDVDIEIILEEK